MQRILIVRGKITVYINTSALLLAAYMCLMGYGELLLIAYLSIILHEGAHTAAACLMGHPPEEIEITPLGALMRLSAQGITRGKRLMILLAGPLMTILLCFASARCVAGGLLPHALGRTLFICNCSILLINLLPCLPLDGGSILALLLSFALPEDAVNKVMRLSGRVIGTAIILGAFYCACTGRGMNLSLVFAGCLLIYAAYASTTSDALHRLRRYMERKTAIELRGMARVEMIAVLSHIPAMHAVRALPANRYARFLILEGGTLRPLGVLSEGELIAAALDAPSIVCGEAVKKAVQANTQRAEKAPAAPPSSIEHYSASAEAGTFHRYSRPTTMKKTKNGLDCSRNHPYDRQSQTIRFQSADAE